MRDEEYVSLQSAFERYDNAAVAAEAARGQVRALFGSLKPEVGAEDEMKGLHKQLLETVRSADLAAQLARGLLGVVAAVQGLNEPAPAPQVPYTPPPGEDYIGT